jgi:uncharacterized membrane protein
MVHKKKISGDRTALFLKGIILLSVIGLLLSLYLTIDHYKPPTDSSFCDISATVSCSLVNTSVFSEVFNVPVSLMGMAWFVFALGFAWQALRKKELFIPALLWWSVVGLLSVAYFIYAEIILRAICPFCTGVHVIVLVIFGLSYLMYKQQKRPMSFETLLPGLRWWVAAFIVITVAIFVIFNLPEAEGENYDELAQCISDNGVLMYGSFRCGVCAKTRAMFDDSFQYITEIECHPQGENAQTELCLEKGIEGTPTWIREVDGVELARHHGFLSTDELRKFAGCGE